MTEVAIIGAGAAGLAAARTLASHGLHPEVFEAADRIGGRACTIYAHHSAELPVELGPEFVHGDPALMKSLLADPKFRTDEVADLHHEAIAGRVRELPNVWKTLSGLLENAPPPYCDESARAYMERSKMSGDDARLFASLVEGFYAAPLDDISVAGLADDRGAEDGASQARPRGGYGKVIGWLGGRLAHKRVPIHLGATVRAIDWTGPGVRIELDDRVVEAAQVIVTLPVGVLKAKTVTFTPPLEDHAEALELLGMGSVVKVVTCFQSPVWKAYAPRRLSFVHAEGSVFPTFWVRSRGDSHQLTAWAGGRHARALDEDSPERRAKLALQSFAAALGMPAGALEAAAVHHHLHDYDRDPLSLGAYSYTRVRGTKAPERLARPLGGRVFFAGEATDTDYEGTITGALQSGIRAANDVLYALGIEEAA